MRVNVTVNGASVFAPLQFSAWTAAPWNAPPFSSLCAPWIATKLKLGSQPMVAVPCQQGWFLIRSSRFLICLVCSHHLGYSFKHAVCFPTGNLILSFCCGETTELLVWLGICIQLSRDQSQVSSEEVINSI